MPRVEPIRDPGLLALRVQQARPPSSSNPPAASVPSIATHAVAAGIQRAVDSGLHMMRPETLDRLGEQRQNVLGHLVDPTAAQPPAASVPEIAKQAVVAGMLRALGSGERIMRPETLDPLAQERQNTMKHLVDASDAQATAGSIPEIAKRAVAAGLQRALSDGRQLLPSEATEVGGRERKRGIGDVLDQRA